MKKILLAVLIVMLAIPMANATLTRLQALGVANWMTDDDANIWFSPTYINKYPKGVWLEMGT